MIKNKQLKVQSFAFLFVLALLSGCNTREETPLTKDGKHYFVIDSTIKSSPVLEKIIAPYREQIQAKMSRVIGYSDVDLPKGRPESPLTNFVADIVLTKGIELAKEKDLPVPVMSVVNTKGLRSPIKKGPVTVESVYRVMPFENKLVILELNGGVMTKLFEHMAEFGGESMAGAEYGIKDGKPVEIKVGGKKFNPDKMYVVIVPDYIANGGDRYFMLKDADKRYDTGILIRDVIIDGIEELNSRNEHIESKLDKRVYYVN
ncbi:MAG: hypothetical protein GXO47_11700 [Chlorobi bacterium]|nr:hypothetical protein [Chlorobiota bacterium]